MPRPLRHEIHPRTPQARLLQYAATQVRAGAIVALPSATGYGLVCRVDDKGSTQRLRRCSGDQAPPALLYRDLAQAAVHLHIDDRAYRRIRAAGDGSEAFMLRSTRRLPRRLTAGSGGASLLQFAGHAVAQGLLELLDEPLLIAQPLEAAAELEALPTGWHAGIDLALDAGPLQAVEAVRVVDLDGLLQSRPRLSRWAGAAPAQA